MEIIFRFQLMTNNLQIWADDQWKLPIKTFQIWAYRNHACIGNEDRWCHWTFRLEHIPDITDTNPATTFCNHKMRKCLAGPIYDMIWYDNNPDIWLLLSIIIPLWHFASKKWENVWQVPAGKRTGRRSEGWWRDFLRREENFHRLFQTSMIGEKSNQYFY